MNTFQVHLRVASMQGPWCRPLRSEPGRYDLIDVATGEIVECRRTQDDIAVIIFGDAP